MYSKKEDVGGDAVALLAVVAVVDVVVDVVGGICVVLTVLFGVSLRLSLRHLLLIRSSCPKKETMPQRGRRTQSPSPACLRTRTGTGRQSPRGNRVYEGGREEREGEVGVVERYPLTNVWFCWMDGWMVYGYEKKTGGPACSF